MLYFWEVLDIIVCCRKAKQMLKRGKEGLKMVRMIHMTPDEVQHFVSVTSRCDFDIDISYNRYTVDAKSFLGVYGLDFNRPLKVFYEGYNAELEELLQQLACAS